MAQGSITAPADNTAESNRQQAEEIYRTRLAAWEKARFAPPPAKPLNPIEPTLHLTTPMRDGIALDTEVFLPPQAKLSADEQGEALPIILVRTPYPFGRASQNGGLMIPRYLAAGYGFVSQQTRGQGASAGVFRFLRDDINDGYDTVQWVAEQPWCNGRVGMQGSSYLGCTQLMAARAKPPALKCIMPTAFIGDFTRSFPFSNGVPKRAPFMQWHQVLDAARWDDLEVAYYDINSQNHPLLGPAFLHRPLIDAADTVLSDDKLTSWREVMANPSNNDFWAPLNFSDTELSDLNLPLFITDGWYDVTVGPADFFTRLETLQPQSADRYLLIGPWDHYQTAANSEPGEDNGDRILPDNGAIDHINYRLAFFDRYLKQQATTTVQDDRVRVYITGAKNSNANIWKNYSTFPAPGTRYQVLYLHSGGNANAFPGNGILDTKTPQTEPTDHYTYDPALPTFFQSESASDRRPIEIRADVLTYTSEPLSEPLTLLGNIQLVLYAASDAPDTDWFTVLTEVFPDGQSKSFHYAPPAFRARYRQGLDKDVLLTPNKPEQYLLSLGVAGHQIAAGHRLRLSIFSAEFPEFDQYIVKIFKVIPNQNALA